MTAAASADDETSALWACIRELAALSAVPSRWIGRTPREVVEHLLEVLTGALKLDLAYASIDGASIVAACAGGVTVRVLSSATAKEVGRVLMPWVDTTGCDSVRSPLDGETVSLAMSRMYPGDGVVIAGSKRPGFPSVLESLVLDAAVDQGVIWLSLARSLVALNRAESKLLERQTSHRFDAGESVDVHEGGAAGLSFGGMVGRSQALHDVLAEVELVAPTDASVLIVGESGTGKELLARELHVRSRRAARPLVKVNCSAIPRAMFESEFFGHARGAFTGAVRDRPGRFSLADTGTILLDEVGELPLELQPKLLRVLQEGQYERVGDDTTRSVDVRVIAATNRDLTAEVRAGRFREDLFFRLSVFPIRIPPLRDRKQDILPLAEHFVRSAAKDIGVEPVPLGPREVAALHGYDWPGNVRELQNVIERAVILGRGNVVNIERMLRPHGEPSSTAEAAPEAPREVVSNEEWRRRERENLIAALGQTSGRIYGARGAAALLGVNPSTLQSRLRALGIRTRARSTDRG